jgi:hypothetical protein
MKVDPSLVLNSDDNEIFQHNHLPAVTTLFRFA